MRLARPEPGLQERARSSEAPRGRERESAREWRSRPTREDRSLVELGAVFVVMLVALALSIRFMAGALAVDDWIEAEATFVDGRVTREVLRDGMSDTLTNDYVVSVVYEYVDPFDQQTRRSDQVLAGGHVAFLGGALQQRVPLTLPKHAAEALLHELRGKGAFPVYINPQDPSDTGIVRMRDLARGGGDGDFRMWLAILGPVAAIALAALGLAYVGFARPDLVTALINRLTH